MCKKQRLFAFTALCKIKSTHALKLFYGVLSPANNERVRVAFGRGPVGSRAFCFPFIRAG